MLLRRSSRPRSRRDARAPRRRGSAPALRRAGTTLRGAGRTTLAHDGLPLDAPPFDCFLATASPTSPPPRGSGSRVRRSCPWRYALRARGTSAARFGSRYRAATSWIVRPGTRHPGARPLLEHRPGGPSVQEMRAFSRSLRSCARASTTLDPISSGSGRAGPSRRQANGLAGGEEASRTGELADHDARSLLRRRRGEDRDVPSGFAARNAPWPTRATSRRRAAREPRSACSPRTGSARAPRRRRPAGYSGSSRCRLHPPRLTIRFHVEGM